LQNQKKCFYLRKNKYMQGDLIMACGCCCSTEKKTPVKTAKKKATKKK